VNKITIEKIIGTTAAHNASLATNPVTEEIAYAAGTIAVLYNPRRNRQVRFFRVAKAVSCVEFSADGKYLAVGEKGHDPGIIVFELATNKQISELKGHKFGVSSIAFSPQGSTLVSVGYKHDRRLYVWNWKFGKAVAAARIVSKVFTVRFTNDSKQFITCGEKHVKFWNLDPNSVEVEGDENENTINVSSALYAL